jgi:branched-chain amino acid transport system permease protein
MRDALRLKPSPVWLAPGLIVLLIALSFYATDSGVLLSIVTVSCIWAIAALGWNVLAGFTGQLSFGHAAFFGAGAYTMALLNTEAGVSPWIGLLAGGVVAAVLAVIIGLPTFRLRGPYFALATLALAEAIRRVVVWQVDLTGGNDGVILPIKTGFSQMFFESNRPFAWLAIGFLALAWSATAWLRYSRLGYYMLAVRDDQDAAAAAGLNPLSVKLRASVVSAFITAIAGGLLGRFLSGVAPEDYLGTYVSIQILIFGFVGGLGTLSGPVVGAMLVVPLQHYLQLTSGSQVTSQLAEVAFGVILVLVILFYPKGITPGVAKLWSHVRARRARTPEPPDAGAPAPEETRELRAHTVGGG